MKTQNLRSRLIISLSALLLLSVAGDAFSQANKRFGPKQRDNDNRKKTTTATAAAPVATPAPEPVAIARPVAQPTATPAASPVPIPDDLTDQLPKEVQTVIADTRVQDAVNMVTEKVQESNTNALLKSAQKAAQDRGGIPSVSEAKERASAMINQKSTEPSTEVPAAAETPAQPAPTASPAAEEAAPVLATSTGAVPAPRPMEAKYQRDSAEAPGTGAQAAAAEEEGEVMKIRSNESEMREKEGLIIFRGDVFVVEPKFTLYGDELEVFQFKEGESPDNDAGSIKKAIATGRIVEIKRMNSGGEAQVAQARRAEYDASTGKVVLTGGPPVMQSGGRLVKTRSDNAKIILTPDGNHQVIDKGITGGDGRDGGSTIIIPMGKKDGEKGDIKIPGAGGLDSIRGDN